MHFVLDVRLSLLQGLMFGRDWDTTIYISGKQKMWIWPWNKQRVNTVRKRLANSDNAFHLTLEKAPECVVICWRWMLWVTSHWFSALNQNRAAAGGPLIRQFASRLINLLFPTFKFFQHLNLWSKFHHLNVGSSTNSRWTNQSYCKWGNQSL